jgi:FdhD protein
MDDKRLLTEIVRYENGVIEYLTDAVVRETVVTVLVNGTKIASIACLDDKLMELGVGFTFTEGIVSDLSAITAIRHNKEKKLIEITAETSKSDLIDYLATTEKISGCGGGISGIIKNSARKAFRKNSLSLNSIPLIMSSFQKSSVLFRETGGVHSAGLLLSESLEYYAEDIGRHNAVDKVIGEALIKQKSLSDYSLLTSGRISSEIVRKAIRLNIPMILSQSAPTSTAISLAWHYGVYLIGFARGKRFNLYTGLADFLSNNEL